MSNIDRVDCCGVDTRCAPYYFLTWLLLALFLSCVALIIGDWILFFHTGKSCQERAAPKWILEHARRQREEYTASRSTGSIHGRYSSPRPHPRSPRRGPGYTPPRQTIRLSASSRMTPPHVLRRDTV
ncbi:hypothetical protein ANO14919_053810 [Xylariales sp. No.14919]|nr:hypothetical protein ANO14919_053810 [Xylariales sp. No.14919]